MIQTYLIKAKLSENVQSICWSEFVSESTEELNQLFDRLGVEDILVNPRGDLFTADLTQAQLTTLEQSGLVEFVQLKEGQSF